MNHDTAAVLLAAAAAGLLTGCGTDHRTANESSAAYTVTEEAVPDDGNSLYEPDDVHRSTDRSEPDVIDRAESALDSAKDAAEEMVTDASRAVSDAARDLTETDRQQ
ncbi:MAG: hypothetical protein IJL32_10600 [Oscillospiraceae bacterium]|nr:hypothetical protein [Oscillospiraceae bacterium]